MRVLVLGGCGYIGSKVCPTLHHRGHTVDVVDLQWFGNHLHSEILVRQENCWNLTAKDFEGYDAAIFLAGLSNDPMADYDPAANYTDNAALPAYLALQARLGGVKKFIHGGSCSVYGYATDREFVETDPVSVRYPYGVSKLQGEIGCLQQADENFTVIAFRQGTVGGYSPRMRTDLVVNAMTMSGFYNHKIIVRTPDIWRPLLDIDDAVRAYTLAIESDQIQSGVYNVATVNIKVIDIAYCVQAAVGRGVPLEIGDAIDARNYRVSTAKASAAMGFMAMGSILNMINGILINAKEIGDPSQERYNNIRSFKALDVGRRAAVA